MSVKGAVMVPHPPLIIPEVGRGREKEIQSTINAYHQAAKQIAAWRPDTVVVLSPHSVMYGDYFHISPGQSAQGNFGQFGAPQVKIQVSYDTEFVQLLSQQAAAQDLPAGTKGERNPQLDHGTMIPLWFLNQYYTGYQAVRIGLSGLPFSQHYRLGECIQETAKLLHRNIAVIGSGDLSHKLKPEGPYGFAPEGPDYDRKIMEVMGSGQFGKLFDFSEDFCRKAAECGHRSFVILAGTLDRMEVKATPLSQEGPFGVGYGVCVYEAKGKNENRDFLRQYEEKLKAEADTRKQSEDPYVSLARRTVETYVRTGRKMEVPKDLPKEMYSHRAGVFVSLKKEGQLRGCIGTVSRCGKMSQKRSWKMPSALPSGTPDSARWSPRSWTGWSTAWMCWGSRRKSSPKRNWMQNTTG